jgi:hypothetical protein
LGGWIRKNNRRDEFNWCILYAWREISQQTPFMQLIYTNKKF